MIRYCSKENLVKEARKARPRRGSRAYYLPYKAVAAQYTVRVHARCDRSDSRVVFDDWRTAHISLERLVVQLAIHLQSAFFYSKFFLPPCQSFSALAIMMDGRLPLGGTCGPDR